MASPPAPHDSVSRVSAGSLAARIGLAALVGFVTAVAATAWRGLPEPSLHDEYSYLLAADTFLEGRLANPPHPHWRHFETFHVLQQPAYASKYPPGQGLLLAVGERLGHPIVGIWLGIAALAGATTWMLRAFFGNGWSLFGGLLVALHYGLPNYWSQSYWGGSLAALGGVLVFGSLPRLLRTERLGEAIAFGVGLAVLALTRPFEGLLMGAACGWVLVVGLWRRWCREPKERIATLRPIVLGTGGVLVVGLGFLAVYHQAVTDAPWDFPYQVYSEQYASAPQFVWQERGAMPSYRQLIHLRFWGSVAARFDRLQSPRELFRENVDRTIRSWRFFLGVSLSLPLAAACWSRRRRWIGFSGALAVAYVAVFWGSQSYHPHYVAPLVGSLVFVVVAGAERLAGWLHRPMGRRAAVLVMLALLASDAAERMLREDPRLQLADRRVAPEVRAEIERHLAEDLGGRHLLLVQLGLDASVHDTWVANRADIDRQPVVFAHDLATPETPGANEDLLSYYSGRTVWRLQIPADPTRFRLKRLRSPVGIAVSPAGAARTLASTGPGGTGER